MYRPVVHLVILAGPAGHHHDVRARDVGERGVGGQVQAGPVIADTAGVFGGEHDLRAGQAAEHLVRADRVQRGEPVKEQDGDLHDSSRVLGGGWPGWRRGGNGGGTRPG